MKNDIPLLIILACTYTTILMYGLHSLDAAQNLRSTQIETGEMFQETNILGRSMTWQQCHRLGIIYICVGNIVSMITVAGAYAVGKRDM